MSTKNTLYYAEDDSGNFCHIYWELAERKVEHGKMVAAPLFISVGDLSREDQHPIRFADGGCAPDM